MPTQYPPYAFVPGYWPHPCNDPDGHSYARQDEPVEPLDLEAWQKCASYVRGIELFNAGYYWEAHEAWEDVWNVLGREGLAADLLKGLIKLAAVGIKIRQGYTKAGESLATQAAGHFRAIDTKRDETLCAGLNLAELTAWCEQLETQIETMRGDPSQKVEVVFARQLEPKSL